MTGKTGIALTLLLMTGLTGFHAHHFRGIAGNPFKMIRRIFFGLTPYRFMAGRAFQFSHLDMGGVREKDIIRLLGIDEPGDVLLFLFQLFGQFYKIGFRLGTSDSRLMTFQAFSQVWDTGKTPIRL